MPLQQRHALLFGPEDFSSLLAQEGSCDALGGDVHCHGAPAPRVATPGLLQFMCECNSVPAPC